MSDEDLIIHPDDKLRAQEQISEGAISLEEMASNIQMNVVTVDVSDSMNYPIGYEGKIRKIELIKRALERWVRKRFNSNENTRIGLVSFSRAAEVLIEVTGDMEEIVRCVGELRTQSNTAMDKGLQEALRMLKQHQSNTDSLQRILLVSDGEPDSQNAVNTIIEQNKDKLITVDTIFIGRERREDCMRCDGTGKNLAGIACTYCDGKGHILSPFLQFMKKIAEATGGVFDMITDESKFDEDFAKTADRLLLGSGAPKLEEETKSPGVIHL